MQSTAECQDQLKYLFHLGEGAVNKFPRTFQTINKKTMKQVAKVTIDNAYNLSKLFHTFSSLLLIT